MIVRLWDTSTWQKIADIAGHTDRINDAHFSPVDRILATSSDDKTVKLWDYDSRRNTATIPDAFSADFSPDGRLLAVLNKEWHVVKPDFYHCRRAELSAMR
jgi:WD40 repeat protein